MAERIHRENAPRVGPCPHQYGGCCWVDTLDSSSQVSMKISGLSRTKNYEAKPLRLS